MDNQKEILGQIKTIVQEQAPDAKVFLFGSRSRGDFNDESDWDILIILQNQPNRILKNKIHEMLFPLSLEINSFINTVVVSEEDWLHHPAYYSLYESTRHETLAL